jgi:hypothetical protein
LGVVFGKKAKVSEADRGGILRNGWQHWIPAEYDSALLLVGGEVEWHSTL